MATNKQTRVAVVVLNWNGKEDSLLCIKALREQTLPHQIVAVDNGSTDGFAQHITDDSDVHLLRNSKNLGFAGGVNTGLRWALTNNYEFVALINNDALPENTWLEELISVAKKSEAGIVTGKLLKTDGLIDSTGDLYTSWGLPYPRGRNAKDEGQYNEIEEVFAASGGASLYRASMLHEIGLFDEDFFAYYEDVDISFRAQLAGWKIMYTPKAIAHHKVGASSSKIPGFTTYMAVKNLPWLLWKNVPWRLMPTIWPRFFVAHSAIIISALGKGNFLPVIKGVFMSLLLFPKKLLQRHHIQSGRKVDYLRIMSLITYDLPPNAHKLRKLRDYLRKLRFWR